jgi:hypothetical protein
MSCISSKLFFVILLLILVEQILSYCLFPCVVKIYTSLTTTKQSTSVSIQPILSANYVLRSVPKKWKSDGDKFEEEKYKQVTGPDEKQTSDNMQMRARYQSYLTDSFPSLIACLNFHYELKERLHSSDFHRTFLKGKNLLKRAERWIAKNDSIALKAHKTDYLLGLLKAVDEECFEEHEIHYKCKGFFKQIISFLDTQINLQPLPSLSDEESDSFTWWKIPTNAAFGILNYPKENDNFTSSQIWKYILSRIP